MILPALLTPLLLPLAIHLQPDNGGMPARQPYLAAAHGQVALTYGAGNSIYIASSNDGGQSFSRPMKVADVDVLALGRHRGPRVTILKDAILVSAVAGEHLSTAPHAHGLPSDGNLTVWRSTDRGATWVRASVVNDVPGAAREGFHSIAADTQGNLFAVWLDLRGKGTQLYGSRSTDGGRTWSKNSLIYASPDGTICECCNASVVADGNVADGNVAEGNGRISVMWRNVLDGARDFYTAASKDGVHFGAAQKVGTGTWKINACPMDGGGLALRDGELYSAWRRDKDVFLAQLGKPELRIGSGDDVAIADGKKGIYVAWTEPDAAGPGKNGIVIALPASAGAEKPKLIGPGGSFATLVALPDGSIVAAWEEPGGIRFERVGD